jgi:hypothetical protein
MRISLEKIKGLRLRVFEGPSGAIDHDGQGHPEYGQDQISQTQEKKMPHIPRDIPRKYTPNTMGIY